MKSAPAYKATTPGEVIARSSNKAGQTHQKEDGLSLPGTIHGILAVYIFPMSLSQFWAPTLSQAGPYFYKETWAEEVDAVSLGTQLPSA